MTLVAAVLGIGAWMVRWAFPFGRMSGMGQFLNQLVGMIPVLIVGLAAGLVLVLRIEFPLLFMGLLAVFGGILQRTMAGPLVRWNREFARMCPLTLRPKVSTVRTFGVINIVLGLIVVGLAIWAPWNAAR